MWWGPIFAGDAEQYADLAAGTGHDGLMSAVCCRSRAGNEQPIFSAEPSFSAESVWREDL